MGLPLTKELPEFATGKWKTVSFQSWKYDTSWDWLMPVVEKIEELCIQMEAMYPEDKHLDDPTGWRAWNYRRISLSVNIESVYKQVVEFIKWYNKQSKP